MAGSRRGVSEDILGEMWWCCLMLMVNFGRVRCEGVGEKSLYQLRQRTWGTECVVCEDTVYRWTVICLYLMASLWIGHRFSKRSVSEFSRTAACIIYYSIGRLSINVSQVPPVLFMSFTKHPPTTMHICDQHLLHHSSKPEQAMKMREKKRAIVSRHLEAV